MWLINTSTLRLEHVLDPEQYPYAILSHTWEEEEVTFDDMANIAVAKKKAGFPKIEWTCRLAQAQSIRYAWVDTCCINKSSSAELTESINSMFAWYKLSTVCFVYLSDLQPQYHYGSDKGWLDRSFLHCKWFTRGWTLQELIAPEELKFHDRDWNFRGEKTLLRDEISDMTGIDAEVLQDTSLLHTVSVAKRMSWAARRRTTRPEDLAYCLLGIFEVNMPMLYGEGDKAFIRLQEEIMKSTNDLTLFSWTSQQEERRDPRPMYAAFHRQALRGIMARSPAEFANCRKLKSLEGHLAHNREFSMTNNGLRIHTFLAKGEKDEDYILDLHATDVQARKVGNSTELKTKRIGIHLKKTPNGFVRRLPDNLFTTTDPSIWIGLQSTSYIRKNITLAQMDRLPKHEIRLDMRLPLHYRLDSIEGRPQNLWDPHRGSIMVGSHENVTAYFDIKLIETSLDHRIRLAVVVGTIQKTSDWQLTPWAAIYAGTNEGSKEVMEMIETYSGFGVDIDLHHLKELIFKQDARKLEEGFVSSLLDRRLFLGDNSTTKTLFYLYSGNEGPSPVNTFRFTVDSALIPQLAAQQLIMSDSDS